MFCVDIADRDTGLTVRAIFYLISFHLILALPLPIPSLLPSHFSALHLRRVLTCSFHAFSLCSQPCSAQHYCHRSTPLLSLPLQRALSAASSGIDGGESFANTARDFERSRKNYEIQFSEFDIIKKSLMKDLQNRCEKVRPAAAIPVPRS